MASKGRKGRAGTQTTTDAPPPPPRRTKPIVPLDDPNGATAFVLTAYKIHTRPATEAEREAWARIAADPIRPHFVSPGANAQDLLTALQKELPAVVTFVPSDPDETWQECTEWIATTKAPNYAAGPRSRELDPEYIAEGPTPLLAMLALLESRLARQKWAPVGGFNSPRVQLWAVYEDFNSKGWITGR